jgi:hypothetical protein
MSYSLLLERPVSEYTSTPTIFFCLIKLRACVSSAAEMKGYERICRSTEARRVTLPTSDVGIAVLFLDEIALF